MTPHSSSFFKCGRWDLNPHERNAHKILSLARLPVPTLPHIAFHGNCFSLAINDSIAKSFLCVNSYFCFLKLFLSGILVRKNLHLNDTGSPNK